MSVYFSRVWWVSFIAVAILNVACSRPNRANCSWSEINHGLGDIRLDGTLELRYVIAASRTLGSDISLVHQVVEDSRGRPNSNWHLTGLASTIVPDGGGNLVWHQLNGSEILISELDVIEGEHSRQPPGKYVGRHTARSLEIADSSGRRWYFQDGYLVRMLHPQDGEYLFQREDSDFDQIVHVSPGGDAEQLASIRRSSGRPELLTIGARRTVRFYWQGSFLDRWMSDSGETAAFCYHERLLSEVTSTNEEARTIRWKPNRGFGRRDAVFLAPVHLAQVNHTAYSYEQTGLGFRLERILPNKTVVTIYNPLRNTVYQLNNGIHYEYRFTQNE